MLYLVTLITHAIDQTGIRHPLPSQACRQVFGRIQSKACSLKKVPVFSLSGHTGTVLDGTFPKQLRDCRDEQSRSRSRPRQRLVQVACHKTRHHRLLESFARLAGICSFSWANQDYPKQTQLFGFLDLLLFVFLPLSLAVQLSHIHFFKQFKIPLNLKSFKLFEKVQGRVL